MDEIRIDGLEIYAYHGVLSEEQEKGQHFFVNLSLYGDFRKAAEEDDLSLSTDYAAVCRSVQTWMLEEKKKLLETVCEKIAKNILLQYPLVKKVRVQVEKPEAPIGLPFRNVSVEIEREWNTCYLSIGSNLGDSRQILERAVEKLMEEETVRVEKVSDFIETKPYGGVEQPDFINGAVKLKTLLQPEELLELLHLLEKEAGRERKVRWGPRTLDLDIVFYGDLVYESETLILPHVDMENRLFVLQPLSQLCPNKRHPVLKKTVAQLLQKLQEVQ